eukprot:CAMPEP_0206177100 /NCGR_PEP_ID=MMETSP1474-20131121/60172_1 /ASSEMBLY_ACC=CAM_ASM_001110 /TAXON_ID=97495 /ORGANISM="Imantonia sp., Strain RCC918" /LENGTH=323 /DNA_ID=CAMNT_0053588651 /DNA_START=24 /DNA_END=995 /DNA_ORIENTATION=-
MQRVRDPAKADLFLVPAFQESAWCLKPLMKLTRAWQASPVDYFNRRRGWDHFAVFHWAQDLLRWPCDSWANDKSHSALRNISKAVGVLRSPWNPENSASVVAKWAAAHNIFEVPYGGSVHDSMFWKLRDRSARRLLAFASFNKQGHENTYQQMSLRTVLEQQCRRSAPECQFLPLSSGKVTMYSLFGERRHPVLKELLHSMHGAVFSLQPAGDDPSRKGIIDSLTVGCIPVIFHKEQQELWPLHWGPWVNDSHVFIPADDLLSGRVDVIQVLRAVPQSRIFNMQQNIARRAQSLVYPHKPLPNDAFETLLDRVQHAAASDTYR